VDLIRSEQIDSGITTVIYNANGQPVEQNDAKGSFALHAYDALGRPTHVWAKDLSGEDVTLRQRMEYGESVSTPKSNNLLGKL
jgi:YD repeat-containing protein